MLLVPSEVLLMVDSTSTLEAILALEVVSILTLEAVLALMVVSILILEVALEVSLMEQCQQLCLDDDGCFAVDYNFSDRPWANCRCWMHKVPPTSTKSSQKIDHYSKCSAMLD